MGTYNIYRYDRNVCSSNASRGGGVLIGTFKDIYSNIIPNFIQTKQILYKFLTLLQIL